MPSSWLLISMTFLTVCEAIQLPAVARESVATMMPPWKRKARVVVPWAILIGHCGLERSSVAARSQDDGWRGEMGQPVLVCSFLPCRFRSREAGLG